MQMGSTVQNHPLFYNCIVSKLGPRTLSINFPVVAGTASLRDAVRHDRQARTRN